MSKGDWVEFDGEISDSCGGGMYSVKLSHGEFKAPICGKMKKNHIRVIPGDKVVISFSPYDMSRGIITRRFR